MQTYQVKVFPSKKLLPKKEQLAWRLAQAALDEAPISAPVRDMVINRLIDNASVAMASLFRIPVMRARDQALSHPRKNGGTLFGVNSKYRFSPEWVAWANGVAVRELDFHDTFLSADYSHPGDSIPTLLAVCQACRKTGLDLLKAIVASYEVHISLVKSICLHKHKIDHIAHLCPAQTAGLGVLLGLDTDTLYQAIGQAVHLSFTTRQSRKGEISSWKAYAPGFSGKMAVEAIDRAMRGEKSPSPIYEGEDSVVAWMLDGLEAEYRVDLPSPGEEKKQILDSYTKAHSAEYQAQALIDLAFEMREKVFDLSKIKEILISTSHHTHFVIGTGSKDPQKMSPEASRETLDHSIMYIFAVALYTGEWHHVSSYELASNLEVQSVWQKIRTREDSLWTEAYHDTKSPSFGGRVDITLEDGSKISGEKKVADAHPLGRRPFMKEDYIKKFQALTEGVIAKKEETRFLELVSSLPSLNEKQVLRLNPEAGLSLKPGTKGVF